MKISAGTAARTIWLAVALLNQVLIPGINEVGDLFEKGRYFLPQLIASAEAMKEAIDEGKEIPVTISASDLCEILKEQFEGGFSVENRVTGDKITWEKTGYVNKGAIQYVIKDFNN